MIGAGCDIVGRLRLWGVGELQFVSEPLKSPCFRLLHDVPIVIAGKPRRRFEPAMTKGIVGKD